VAAFRNPNGPRGAKTVPHTRHPLKQATDVLFVSTAFMCLTINVCPVILSSDDLVPGGHSGSVGAELGAILTVRQIVRGIQNSESLLVAA